MNGRALAAAIVALDVLAAQPRAQDQRATFSTRREIVRVDALVTERGQPVRGLEPADFQIFDNDVPQKVELVSFEQIPLNVVLAFDMSSSVTGERLEHLRTAGPSLMSGLATADQAALITFSHVVSQLAPLSHDFARVRRALEVATPPGDTALVDGVYTAMMIGESDVGRGLVIVFSDGLDTASWLPASA